MWEAGRKAESGRGAMLGCDELSALRIRSTRSRQTRLNSKAGKIGETHERSFPSFPVFLFKNAGSRSLRSGVMVPQSLARRRLTRPPSYGRETDAADFVAGS